jgi:hypothetical protein
VCALADALWRSARALAPRLRPVLLFSALATLLVDDLALRRFRAWAVRCGGVFVALAVAADRETTNNSSAVNRRMGEHIHYNLFRRSKQ